MYNEFLFFYEKEPYKEFILMTSKFAEESN